VPAHPGLDESVPHAPKRVHGLDSEEIEQALSNALRYVDSAYHDELRTEFLGELNDYGHIYMYRYRPTEIAMKAYPIHLYPCKTKQAACMMHQIMNNLDYAIAQYPNELVTYGGNGQVFSNWMQFRLTMHYLSIMNEEQTLVMNSGHPLGLFPSSRNSPRCIITNGMMIPRFSTPSQYQKSFALGVTQYGQMTAGSWCYIGPQGIVHGTTLTVLNAFRRKFGSSSGAGRVFITSGLGGMSGAQAKAATICGCIGVIAEIDKSHLIKRQKQGWLDIYTDDVDEIISLIRHYREEKRATSIGYHGNIVRLWEKLVEVYEKSGELLVDIGSDQTSCHDIRGGGYLPIELTAEDAKTYIATNEAKYLELVRGTLCRHINALNKLSKAGLYFFDYGNAFLLEAGRAGADVFENGSTTKFKYPSYVQHIMGDIFSLGFGPYRWICSSGKPSDLKKTDEIAISVLEGIVDDGISETSKRQYEDNLRWIKEAEKHKLVVGSQARILYTDMKGRWKLAEAFNKAVAKGDISAPIILSRDHHDVSGTDSPFRETSNIYDGSTVTADMAVQNCLGDAARGATWVSLHNGGGVGWGEVINGGFGHVLDGSEEQIIKARRFLSWDVANGVARRCWSGNALAKIAIQEAMETDPNLIVTLPN